MLTDHVAVLNESAARALWPNDDPIGRRIIGGRRYTVVGVIRDVKMRRLDTVPSPQIYSNFLQEPVGTEMPVTLVTRAKDNGVVVGTRIRDAIRSLDHEVNTTVLTMKDVRWSITSAERFRTTVILIFAWTALFLALLGTAGVVGFTVSHRQRCCEWSSASLSNRRQLVSSLASSYQCGRHVWLPASSMTSSKPMP